MKFFYSILLHFAELELAIAKAAPIRNAQRVAACQADVDRWEKALFDFEWRMR